MSLNKKLFTKQTNSPKKVLNYTKYNMKTFNHVP